MVPPCLSEKSLIFFWSTFLKIKEAPRVCYDINIYWLNQRILESMFLREPIIKKTTLSQDQRTQSHHFQYCSCDLNSSCLSTRSKTSGTLRSSLSVYTALLCDCRGSGEGSVQLLGRGGRVTVFGSFSGSRLALLLVCCASLHRSPWCFVLQLY